MCLNPGPAGYNGSMDQAQMRVALDGLFAYDTGAGPGIHDDGVRHAALQALRALPVSEQVSLAASLYDEPERAATFQRWLDYQQRAISVA
ncbi:MAG: hypothetical protein JWP74_3827 [Marmoricola sp.]|nr:hypothetical protein [Marmoricola sp.]